MIEHGGKRHAAAMRYGIPLSDWLDLSTGINPNGWPVPSLPPSVWSRLPEDDDGLLTAARNYYGTESLLPVAGSQAAIQALPRFRAPCDVAVIAPGYAEHAHCWQRTGHRVKTLAAGEIDTATTHCDVVVIIHPNNPTGDRFSTDQLLAWQSRLAARGGWLIVDEAFIDATPDASLACFTPRPGLILLRSLGKFFGLAGTRVGVVIASSALLEKLQNELGPWTIAGPSRMIATQALTDRAWQTHARAALPKQSQRLAQMLTAHGLEPNGGSALFQWVRTPRAGILHQRLARAGVLTRLFMEPASLRFGLPADETGWVRLDAALRSAVAP